jgi:thiosulfate reductase cytochrome b subunit
MASDVGGCVVSSGKPSCGETMTTGARASKPHALVVRRHHLLVRISHWLTIPLLLGLILSGISIYWASPVYRHNPDPQSGTFDNALQRLAYFAVAAAGFLAVATGWAIHKPAQLSWLTAIFGGFDNARVWHFWLMVFFVMFVIPHVVLVIADGWNTLRSMITGWSTKFKRSEVSDHEL